MTLDLFQSTHHEPWLESIGEGIVVLHRYALACGPDLLTSIGDLARQAGFRNMITPGGHQMSAAMTCAGDWGWVTDRKGYRYQHEDPQTGAPWPAIPERFSQLAGRAAEEAGFPGFQPDACLINRYEPGAKMGLHQDRDERDFPGRLFRYPWGCPLCSKWVAQNAVTNPSGFYWSMAMWWFGAARRG